MEIKATYYEVRCPCESEHSIGDTQFSRCGAMLGAVEENGSSYHRCPTHGMIFVDHSENSMEFTILGKKIIKFEKSWRRVNDEQ